MCRFNWYIIIQILCLILKSDSNLICFQLLKRLIELHQIVHQKPKTYFHILSEFWHHYCRSRSIFTFVKKIVFDHNFHNTVAKISVHPPPPRSFSLLSPPLIVVAYLWSGCPAVTHTHTQTHTHTHSVMLSCSRGETRSPSEAVSTFFQPFRVAPYHQNELATMLFILSTSHCNTTPTYSATWKVNLYAHFQSRPGHCRSDRWCWMI